MQEERIKVVSLFLSPFHAGHLHNSWQANFFRLPLEVALPEHNSQQASPEPVFQPLVTKDTEAIYDLLWQIMLCQVERYLHPTT